jgi:hypothetical protein
MKNTSKDRRDKKRRKFYKELCDTDFSDETYKKFGLTKQDMHSAIRMTSSVKGARDCSRSAYKHLVKLIKDKAYTKQLSKDISEVLLSELRPKVTCHASESDILDRKLNVDITFTLFGEGI